jgi:16S rRNA processing protein RimM
MTTICLGKIIAVYGTRGEVEIESYTERPTDIASFGAVKDAKGTKYHILSASRHTSRTVIARIQGVSDPVQALEICGVELFTERALAVLKARRLH